MLKKAFIRLLLGLIILSTTQAMLIGGELFNCESEQVLDGSLPTDSTKWSLQTISSKFTSSAFPWPDISGADESPQVKFAVKKVQSAAENSDRRLVFQMGLESKESQEWSIENSTSFVIGKSANISPGLINTLDGNTGYFNCYVDRSDQNRCSASVINPRCCYDDDYASVHSEMSALYPTCQVNSCPYLQNLAKVGDVNDSAFSCRAVCSYNAILQVEFGDNEMEVGGKIVMSMVASRVALIQSNGEFNKIDNDLGESHFQTQAHQGSPISTDVTWGFWVRWTVTDAGLNRGPVFEIGLDGHDSPFFLHSFDQHCFDCYTQDQHGWNGKDVQLPRADKVFKPTVWNLDAVEGNKFHVFKNCSNIIYNKHQDQKKLGGSCLTTDQCRRSCTGQGCSARLCLSDGGLSKELAWTNHKTCQIAPNPGLPLEIWLLFSLLGYLIVLMVVVTCCTCYYVGSKNPKLREAKNVKVEAPSTLKDDYSVSTISIPSLEPGNYSHQASIEEFNSTK
jgi:hypothetical protein